MFFLFFLFLKLLLAGEIWPQWRDPANVDKGKAEKSNSFKKEIADAGNLLPDTSHCGTSAKMYSTKCANERTICCKNYTFDSDAIVKQLLFYRIFVCTNFQIKDL